jgi:hypothetical protein
MADETRAKARFGRDGAVTIELAGASFDDPDKALRAADSLRDVALRANTVRAGLIAEEKALVGSAAHHMDRGASAAFHYDRRAAHTGVPLQEGDLDIGNQQEPDEFRVPGNSPATGTSPESDAAIARNDETAGVRESIVEADVMREKIEERDREKAEEKVNEHLERREKAEREAEQREGEQQVELESGEGGSDQESKSVKPQGEKQDGPSRQTPSGRSGRQGGQ